VIERLSKGRSEGGVSALSGMMDGIADNGIQTLYNNDGRRQPAGQPI